MKINAPEYDLSTAVWFKSSYSAGDGSDCVEVATWRKSSFSDASGGDCLEVSVHHPGVIPVRDSKNPDGPKLAFRAAAWATFIEGVTESR
ncbi:DUF397 domain-containing protein [Streptomyces sp. NPDC014870]|uniref:DUF397 domain-containing protein n=1 Tax=Streptomyces sp. NPDC014870 TaxID=3364925 RepID=UPI0036F64A07